MLKQLHIRDFDIRPVSDNPTFHPGRCAEIFKSDTTLGIVGEVHPLVLGNYSIGTKAYLAKFDEKSLFEFADPCVEYTPLPKFPATTRDLSLLCEKDLPIIQIEKAIKASGGAHLESVALFDVYEGEQIAPDKKSVSYSLILRSKTSTLTDEEADAAVKRILKGLEKINVVLREK